MTVLLPDSGLSDYRHCWKRSLSRWLGQKFGISSRLADLTFPHKVYYKCEWSPVCRQKATDCRWRSFKPITFSKIHSIHLVFRTQISSFIGARDCTFFSSYGTAAWACTMASVDITPSYLPADADMAQVLLILEKWSGRPRRQPVVPPLDWKTLGNHPPWYNICENTISPKPSWQGKAMQVITDNKRQARSCKRGTSHGSTWLVEKAKGMVMQCYTLFPSYFNDRYRD